jgi:hypothetical protein
MTEMSNKEIKKFLMQGTLTGKLATVKKNGSSHVGLQWTTVIEVGRGISFLLQAVCHSKQEIFNVIIE